MTSTGSNFQYMWPHAYATLLLMSAFDSINMKEFVKRSCAITLHALSEGVRGIQESSFSMTLIFGRGLVHTQKRLWQANVWL